MSWFERLLDSVADHGLELLGRLDGGQDDSPSDAELCHRLVGGQGEASNIALAREILQRWEAMDEPTRLAFMRLLAVDFAPNPEAIQKAAQAYRPNNLASLDRLMAVTEPPRQELMRRLNMAPNGTASLVDMRAFLLSQLRAHPDLTPVDRDFQHLLGSWFNRGFLRLERIDWNTPAAILEKLIRYESVHPMGGWDDLRRRLGTDRRCFAFFHPALPTDPLIFVEIALTQGISEAIAPLIDPAAPETDPSQADTAIFYSINNALLGLRGISFGNFLIKQVALELQQEFSALQHLVTLSPLPRLRSGIAEVLQGTLGTQEQTAKLQNLIAEHLHLDPPDTDPMPGLDAWFQGTEPSRLELLSALALFYLTHCKRGDKAYDPVAHFHLSNGAQLEAIRPAANPGPRGMRDAWGCMVNYRYDAAQVVTNHEAYACRGEIRLSRELTRNQKDLDETLDTA